MSRMIPTIGAGKYPVLAQDREVVHPDVRIQILERESVSEPQSFAIEL